MKIRKPVVEVLRYVGRAQKAAKADFNELLTAYGRCTRYKATEMLAGFVPHQARLPKY